MASQGVMQRSIWLLLSNLDVWDQLESFIKVWTLPWAVAKAGKLHDLFTAKKVKGYKESSKFKCTASEALGLVALLAYMVSAVYLPMGAAPEQCQSFLDMVAVMDLLQATHLGQVDPRFLQQLGFFRFCFCMHVAMLLEASDGLMI